MDTTVNALQNLYVAIGGDIDDVSNLVTIPDMINAIAEQVEANKTDETSDETFDENTEENSDT